MTDTKRADMIVKALEQMNHADPSEWNEDATPKLTIVRGYAKDQTVTDAEVAEVAAGWRRQEPTRAEIEAGQDGDDEVEGEADPAETVRTDGSLGIDFTKVPPERVQELKDYKVELQALIDEQAALRDAAINRLNYLNHEMDKLIERLLVLDRPVGHADEVRAFLARSHAENERRARQNAALAAAIGVRMPSHPSPLDAAMAHGFSPNGGTKRRSAMGPSVIGNTLDLGPVHMTVGPGQR